MFSVTKNQLIDLSVEENVNQIEEENNSHSEHSEINNCKIANIIVQYVTLVWLMNSEECMP